ncbi:MAG TPA: hypothetical protein VMV27_01945 [Candidatus Binataceae bacterium]|nr:hypothetical protein [Candidatus Binataceae bacterium]
MADLQRMLLPYQQEWIADEADVKVAEKSRRIGFTWAESADDVLQAARADGKDVWYIAYEQEIAREFIEDCAFWAKLFNEAASEMREVLYEDEGKAILAYRIDFASGHKIVALSSRPRNLRGRDGIAVLDEFAFVDDPDELLKAAMAFLVWGGKVRIISTHNGAENPFNTLVNDCRSGRVPYSLHRVDFNQAQREGLYRKVCERTGKPWSRESEIKWRDGIIARYRENVDEELFCIPRFGGSVPLPRALIESRMTADAPVIRWERDDKFVHLTDDERRSSANAFIKENLEPLLPRLNPELLSFFGEDFGRTLDLTVIWPMQLGAALKRLTPFVVELRNVPYRQQEQILFWIVDHLPRFTAGALDAGGNGGYLAEAAMQRYGEHIAPVRFTVDWYLQNMPGYIAAFQDDTIELPLDTDILNDHSALRTEKGITRVPDVRTRSHSGAGKRHGDSAIAGALAFFASKLDVIGYDYTPAPRATKFGDAKIGDDDDDGKSRGNPFGGPARFGRGAW